MSSALSLASSCFWLLLTLAIYCAALRICALLRGHVLANPVLIGTALLVGLLGSANVSYADYLDGGNAVLAMLGPATTALAVPLFGHMVQLRRSILKLAAAATIGTVVASLSAVLIARSLGASDIVLRSIAPRASTTAIAIGVSDQIGGHAGLTAALVIVSGVIGAVTSGWIFNVLGLRQAPYRGLGMGVVGHGIATAKALAVNAEAGAFASVGMALAGILTGLLLPMSWSWFCPS